MCGNLIWIRFDKSFESSLIIFCHKMGFNSKFRTYKIIKLVNWNFNIYKALKKKEYFFELHQNLTSFSQLPVVLCPIHLVTFTLISILVTDYIQKRRGQASSLWQLIQMKSLTRIFLQNLFAIIQSTCYRLIKSL